MPRDYRTINDPVTEYDESARCGLNIGADGQSAVRYLICWGSDRRNLIRSILGYSTFEPPNRVHRFPPEPHPEHENLVARSAEFVRELGPPSQEGPFGSLQFNEVEVAVNYEATPGIKWLRDEFRPANFDVGDESFRYVATAREYGIEGRIIPKGILFFNKEAPPPFVPGIHLQVPEPGTVMQPNFSLRLVMKQLPVVYDEFGSPRLPGNMEANWAATIGKMNSVPFRGYPPETLVACAPSADLKSQPDGSECWEITHCLMGRGEQDLTGVAKEVDTASGSWTRLLNASGTYSRVYRSSDAVNKVVSLYRGADLRKLFTVS